MNSPLQSVPVPHTLGLIGIGLMGTACAERFLTRGVKVVGWDLSPERRSAFVDLGGSIATDINEVFATCDRVVLSLPTHEIVDTVLTSANGSLRPGQIVIDTSTGDPNAAVSQATRLERQQVQYLDATISGSSQQLRDGSAVFLVGGTDLTFQACADVFAYLSNKVFHTGPVGSGARMKLVTNLVLGLNRAALAEGLCFAKLLGLDLEQALFLLRESMSYSRIMDTKGDKMLRGDFTPQAKLSQHLKDVQLMLSCAQGADGNLPLTTTHRDLLERAMQMGLGDLDNSAVLQAIENLQS